MQKNGVKVLFWESNHVFAAWHPTVSPVVFCGFQPSGCGFQPGSMVAEGEPPVRFGGRGGRPSETFRFAPFCIRL